MIWFYGVLIALGIILGFITGNPLLGTVYTFLGVITPPIYRRLRDWSEG